MTELEKKLDYSFKNINLLITATTHSSYSNENKKKNSECNERLEFLGDSILGMTVANYLYRNHPEMSEGVMTRMRAELVCETSLANVAEQLDLGRYLLLGKGEEQGGGRTRKSIIADAVEAVIAAVFLDGGYDKASHIIYKYILDPVSEGKKLKTTDNKTELQELAQKKTGSTLTYCMVGESGPDHCKMFEFSVSLNGREIGIGSGRTKKEAEQAAAGNALKKLKNEA